MSTHNLQHERTPQQALTPPCCPVCAPRSFFRNPLGSVAFLQKLVQKESQDPSAPAGSRPGSSLGPQHDRAPYELDSEEEAAAGEGESEEEGPSREPSGFFRAFKATKHGSKTRGKGGHAAGAAAAASSPPSVVAGRGSGGSSSAAAGAAGSAGGHMAAAAVAPSGHVAPAAAAGGAGSQGVAGPMQRPETPRGQASIAVVAPAAAPEMAGYTGAGGVRGSARGGEAGRGLL